MEYETLLFEVEHGVAGITLNRPDAANSLDLTMARELMQAAIRCDEDRSVRAVVIGALGRFFCAGGDVASFAAAGKGMPALVKEITTYLHAAVSLFARMRAPVILAVGGTAAGAGMSLACAGDLAVAGESTKFSMAYTGVGLVPDGSGTWYLPRLVGRRRALELMLLNRPLTAAEALAWGLVNEVVPDAKVNERAVEIARRLASGATEAFGATKRLVLASGSESLETQMELESRAIAGAARTSDAQEGVRAFLEKRSPAFLGE
jgi:2-(1,2-epoxy-1,2-dihydrophenyl)acetyl-CoA isomerase